MFQRTKPRNRHERNLWAFWPFFTSFGGYLVVWGASNLFGALIHHLHMAQRRYPGDRAYYIASIESDLVYGFLLIALGIWRIRWRRRKLRRTAAGYA